MPDVGRQLYKPLHLNSKQYIMGFKEKKESSKLMPLSEENEHAVISCACV